MEAVEISSDLWKPRQYWICGASKGNGTALANLPPTSNFANPNNHPMVRLFTLAFACILTAAIAHAQTSDLVFFTDDGAKFTLIVDGDVKNEKPASRVVATGIRTETPVVMVKFEDAAIPQIKKPGFFELGKEYTVMITTNKKGERVLRPSGEAALGTAAKAEPAAPVDFVDDAPASTPVMTTGGTTTGNVEQTTTVVTTEGTSNDANFNMGVNGMGIDMNIKVNDGLAGTGTTTTTTTTTHTTTTVVNGSSTTGTATTAPAPTPVKEPEVYRMPGYSGPIGCAWPMNGGEFADAKKSIEEKSFEGTKATMAKQIGRDRCFTAAQVKEVMEVFSFEDTKLDFAKFAYDRTYDIGNYYKVNDAFSFESSIDELNKYVGSR